MKSQLTMLLEPTTFAGMQCLNHACRSATSTRNFYPGTGIPTAKFFELYKSLATGKPGIIIMEEAFVEENGYTGRSQLGIHTDKIEKYHRDVIHAIKQVDRDIRVVALLAHAGPVTSKLDARDVNKMNFKDFTTVADSFAKAATRAQLCGYDAIQLAADRGLIAQALSPYLNHRTDTYNAKDMLPFALIHKAITQAITIPFGVRLSCQRQEDSEIHVKEDIEDGLESLQNVQNPDFMVESSFGQTIDWLKIVKKFKFDFVELCAKEIDYIKVLKRFKKGVNSVPIIVTGGLDQENAEHALWQGASMVGFSRQFLRDDQFLRNNWAHKCAKCIKCQKMVKSTNGVQCPFKKKDMKEKKTLQERRQSKESILKSSTSSALKLPLSVHLWDSQKLKNTKHLQGQ